MNTPSETLLNALENERRYVAKELHDGVAQTTLQLGLQAGICGKLLERGNLELLATELAQLEQRIQLASRQIREVISDMRPPAVEETAGLKEYIEALIEDHTRRGGPPVNFEFDWLETDLSPAAKLTLTRVVQEALLNIRKHAKAGQVWVTFSIDPQYACVMVVDDGQGFDLNAQKRGSGLENMGARLEALGGSLNLGRPPAGRGTQLIARLPK
ncbi:MAG: sensor histidine kinase [Anaerolineaceae bacterium]|nr:sensor histidine kinase [Anaerolineaceae bacterium]MCB9101410.1 sensor histidine kinase [Anaerolineales bacterium]